MLTFQLYVENACMLDRKPLLCSHQSGYFKQLLHGMSCRFGNKDVQWTRTAARHPINGERDRAADVAVRGRKRNWSSCFSKCGPVLRKTGPYTHYWLNNKRNLQRHTFRLDLSYHRHVPQPHPREEKFVRHCAGQISFQYIQYINSYVYCEEGTPSVGVTSPGPECELVRHLLFLALKIRMSSFLLDPAQILPSLYIYYIYIKNGLL